MAAPKEEPKAEEPKEEPKAKLQGKDGVFYLINPAGGIHSVTRQHAKTRLAVVGWRLATEAEIKVYLKPADPDPKVPTRGLGPVAPRFNPDPDAMLVDLGEE